MCPNSHCYIRACLKAKQPKLKQQISVLTTPKRKTHKEMGKNGHLQYSWTKRTNMHIFQMYIPPKTIYRLNVILIIKQRHYIIEMKKIHPKIHIEPKGHSYPK